MSFVAIGLLFHPNMAYACIPLPILYINDVIENKKTPTTVINYKTDWVILIISLLLIAAYALFILQNKTSFFNDMTYQLERKLSRKPFYSIPKNLIFLFLITTASLFFLFMKKRTALVLTTFALSFFIIAVNGQEMWYRFFQNLCYVLIIIAVCKTKYNKNIKYAAIIIFIFYSTIILTKDYYGMTIPNAMRAGEYIDKPTQQRIQNTILDYKKRTNRDSLTVTFFSNGVDLFFVAFANINHIRIVHKMPDAIQTLPPADIAIFINRPQDPEWHNEYHKPVWRSEFIRIVSTINDQISVTRTTSE
jgi:hypothetical protein